MKNNIKTMEILQQNQEDGELVGHKTHVTAKYFFEIKNTEDIATLHDIFHFSQENNLEILFITGGTNILFAQKSFPGIVIKNSLWGWKYNEHNQQLFTFSGEKIWEIAENLEKKYNQNIWHRFIWLPGAIAGAVVGNAGCFGLETENNFVSAHIFDMEKNQEFTLTKDEMNFSYRHSILKEKRNWFLVSATFDLSEVREKYSSDVDNIDFRENKQPKGNSCGSFFKNPSKEFSAWFLIEKVGLKWFRHGGAYFSDLHANFLLSDGETCEPKDLIELVRIAQEKVKQETGFELVNEVRIIE